MLKHAYIHPHVTMKGNPIYRLGREGGLFISGKVFGDTSWKIFSGISSRFFLFLCPIGGKWVMVKLFSMKTIDSGAILKSYVDSHGISPKWLALQLNCHRTNLYKIFKKQHLDTFTILKFSEVLEHNFFEDIAVQYTNSQISTDSLPNE